MRNGGGNTIRQKRSIERALSLINFFCHKPIIFSSLRGVLDLINQQKQLLIAYIFNYLNGLKIKRVFMIKRIASILHVFPLLKLQICIEFILEWEGEEL